MASKSFLLLPWLLVLGFSLATLTGKTRAFDVGREEYIVYMGDLPQGDLPTSALHTNMLRQVLGSTASTSLLYSYNKSFNGFVAKLTEEERLRVAGMDGVVSIFRNNKIHLHTTRSWDFMGFAQKVNRTTVESDVIIGVLDSGIWPESDSFKDEGFGPPPSKWKGGCDTSANFTCNNKIIGARYYKSNGEFSEEDLKSPRDTDGHGTHTASIAAGGLVSQASLFGLAKGTARGGVPSARIAVYKMCWSDGCADADVLAAFDDAIADGVDIISLSVGGSAPKNYFDDPIAIGSFHALKKGILTSTSGGNDGPDLGSITNVAPWFLSVAASTTDRKFSTKVQLGNNIVVEGISINTFEPQKRYGIIYAGDAPNTTANYTGDSSRYCSEGTLDRDLVKDKIVLCDATDDGEAVVLAGAAGTVMRDDDLFRDYANTYPIPATIVERIGADAIANYINSTRNPIATIFKSNEFKDRLAPYVASFSSRGPSLITGHILKPDITAPGAEILAAWSMVSPVTRVPEDDRRVPYNVRSGTSMACPHASGVAAYIKSFQPSWSPAAIKSAMMTTAFPLRQETSPEAEFAYGAGHISPLKALNPGLIYDADEADYVKFLCGQGYNTSTLQLVTGDRSTCSNETNGVVWDLNLPSLTLATVPLKPFSQIFNRVVTNVGAPSSKYKATVRAPHGLKIKVEPSTLNFKSLGEKLSFKVKVEGAIGRTLLSASLVWDDGTHQVRCPIVVHGYLTR